MNCAAGSPPHTHLRGSHRRCDRRAPGSKGGPARHPVYGTAPDRSGRGYATRAVQLTANWLLHEQRASMVGLRIDVGNTASQRVAAAAGCTAAATIRSYVPGTGETYDFRFVLRRH
jgi:RimJ/RimL family protein N-acetyltransferase